MVRQSTFRRKKIRLGGMRRTLGNVSRYFSRLLTRGPRERAAMRADSSENPLNSYRQLGDDDGRADAEAVEPEVVDRFSSREEAAGHQTLSASAVEEGQEGDYVTVDATEIEQNDLPVAPLGLLRVFGTLLTHKLSGVKTLAIFSNGDQNILLIGEYHGTNFCKSQGFTPICQLIEPFLQETRDIEFMIETPSEHIDIHPFDEEMLARVREVSNLEENEDLFTDYPMQKIINLTRILVMRFMKPPKLSKRPYEVETLHTNSHVSWLEPQIIHTASENIGNAMIRLFDNLKFALVNKNAAQFIASRFSISKLLQKYCDDDVLWLKAVVDFGRELDQLTPEDVKLRNKRINEAFSSTSDAAKEQFVLNCFGLLFQSKYFEKCVSTKERRVDSSIYVMLFMQSWHELKKPNLNYFYKYLQRFFVDIFTVCRLLKRHAHRENDAWFKNVVIYAGDWHTTNVGRILRALNYTEYKLPPLPQFELNPTCARRTVTIGGSRKRANGKTNKKIKSVQRSRSVVKTGKMN